MIKKCFTILIVSIFSFSLVACDGKIKRMEPNKEIKTETEKQKEETVNGYTQEEKEELEKSALPEVELDNDEDNIENNLSEEEAADMLENIIEEYKNDGPIILPEQILE